MSTTAVTDDENIQFSMPTKIPFALKADGSVIAPNDWAMTIGQGSPLVKVSGFHIDGFPTGVTISGETDPCATWSNRGHETPEGDGRFVLTDDGGGKVAATGGTDDDPLCWTYGPNEHGKKDISWNLKGVDGNRGLLDGAADGETSVGTVSITVEVVKPQTFAIISDNGQMNFYHRIRVPSPHHACLSVMTLRYPIPSDAARDAVIDTVSCLPYLRHLVSVPSSSRIRHAVISYWIPDDTATQSIASDTRYRLA